MTEEVTYIAVAVCVPVSVCIYLQDAALKSEGCHVHRWVGRKFQNLCTEYNLFKFFYQAVNTRNNVYTYVIEEIKS
jgi:hypothetical protein